MAADETYRKFHSGRFGPGTLDINFNTEISGTKGVSGNEPSSKPKLGKDKAGNTYKDQATADEFDSQNEFMKD